MQNRFTFAAAEAEKPTLAPSMTFGLGEKFIWISIEKTCEIMNNIS